MGLDELAKLKAVAEQTGIEVILKESTKRADDPDESVLTIAYEGGYTLIASNENLAKVAESIGIRVIKGKTKRPAEPIFQKYFTKDTMSVHLKEGSSGQDRQARQLGACGHQQGAYTKVELEKVVRTSREGGVRRGVHGGEEGRLEHHHAEGQQDNNHVPALLRQARADDHQEGGGP
jgi:predicted PilT family ATPase